MSTPRGIWRALTAEWRLKLALSAGLTIFFCVPYFTLQRVSIVPAARLPLGAIDLAVPFVPAWVWVYQSIYLLLTVVPWLLDSAGALHRYGRGFVLQSAVGFAFFLLLPVEGPRPDRIPQDGMFGLLASYDRPLNCFPSLHVALATYTVCIAASAFRRRLPVSSHKTTVIILSAWVVAIAAATLFTKQHYAIDLPAGALLGWLSHRWAWTRPSERSPHARTIRSGARPDPVGLMPRSSGLRATARGGGAGRPGGGGPPGAPGSQADLRAGHS
ncbi:MAG TPA: phosphatase PAP2 family protein [Vicinamibacterales bacterium]|nr:phosphatase PAP2 family protein [Vicinamibacterales bacterium]